MYLTQIPLNRRNRKFMAALISPNIFHGALESAFIGERKRRLWRIDQVNGEYKILLLSEDMPEMSSFCKQFGCDESGCETQNYDKLLDRISDGSRWRFRLTANPTTSEPQGRGVRGKVAAHITPEFQKKWLMDKAQKNGFMLTEDLFDAVKCSWYRFKKNGRNHITLLAVAFEGVLEVKNAELFRTALINGIGREKAYGMGLLTIMRTE